MTDKYILEEDKKFDINDEYNNWVNPAAPEKNENFGISEEYNSDWKSLDSIARVRTEDFLEETSKTLKASGICETHELDYDDDDYHSCIDSDSDSDYQDIIDETDSVDTGGIEAPSSGKVLERVKELNASANKSDERGSEAQKRTRAISGSNIAKIKEQLFSNSSQVDTIDSGVQSSETNNIGRNKVAGILKKFSEKAPETTAGRKQIVLPNSNVSDGIRKFSGLTKK